MSHILISFTPQFYYFCDKILRLKHINSYMGVLYQSIYILSKELIIDEFFNWAHFSDQAWKRNIYGLTSPFFVYHHWCGGLDKEWCLNFPPLRRREIYELKNRQIWRKRRRRPHVGSCAEVGQIRRYVCRDVINTNLCTVLNENPCLCGIIASHNP